MKIRAVLLDDFGVITDYNILKSEIELARVAGMSHDQMLIALKNANRPDFAWGKISSAEFLKGLNQKIEKQLSWPELVCQWTLTYNLRTESVQMLQRVRLEIPIFLVSNHNDIDCAWMQARQLNSKFDGSICSHNLGVNKPETIFFEEARAMVSAHLKEQIDFKDLLLIDDTADNVAAARSLGLHAEHCTDQQTLMTVLSCYGFQSKSATTIPPVPLSPSGARVH